MAKSRSKSGRKILLAFVVVLVIALVASQAGLLTSAPNLTSTAADTKTYTYDWYGAYGGGATGNCLPSDVSCSPAGHLLDQDGYVASYDQNQIGQRATAIGAALLNPNECTAPFGSVCAGISVTEFQIQLALVYPGETTGRVVGNYTTAPNRQLVETGKWYQEINTYWDIISPDGKTIIPSGTVLKALLRAHVVWTLIGVLGPYQVDKGWGPISSTQANVITGIGTIQFTNAHSDTQGNIYYLTGETATFQATVGYVSQPGSATPAWNVYAYCQATNTVCYGPADVTQLTQSFSFKIPDSAFSNKSSNNEVVIQLRNALYDYDFKVAATVRAQDVVHMPTCTQPIVSPQSPQQGQTVTLKFSCAPASGAAIDQIAKIKVEWGYGTIENTVYLAGSATSFSFTASQSGYATVAITAYTVGNVPSGTSNTKIQIDHQVANTCSNGAPSCSTNPGGIPLWIIFAAIGIIAAAMAAFLPSDLGPGLKMRPFVRVIVLIVGVVFIGIALLVFPG